MSLSIQILKGSRYGETIQIDKTTSLGRAADIVFDDPKMSKIHIIFELDRVLGWILKDPGSKNGVLVNGNKSKQHLLIEGDLIEFGETQLRVASVASFWKPVLNQLLLESLDWARNAPMEISVFRTIPVLSVVEGLQTGEKFVLEYGPRLIGGECEDIQLFEPHCPDVAFEVSPSAKGVVFQTKYPKVVRLNGLEESKKILKNDDRIQIHNTVIQVSFLNT
jgi:hypothetical protein